jgi:3-(3-hydroxy-phenyl)propionate hydroxylase
MVIEDKNRVLVVGGGPVGMVTALALAMKGVPVTVFERFETLLDDPRAATTHPATLELLARLGMVDQMREHGLVCPMFQFWDRESGTMVAEFDHALLKDETEFPYVIQCEQFKTAQIAYRKLQQIDCAEVFFQHEVVDVKQESDGAKVEVLLPGGAKRWFSGRFVVGADGGRSVVRKSIGIPFDGFTWPECFVVLTTPFDFQKVRPYSYRNYFADPHEWCNCFKVAAEGPPGLWRTVFPGHSGLPEETLISDAAVQERLKRFFQTDADYPVVHRNVYKVHQRVAQTFYQGHVVLAGDAAHVNNPIGGVGLNSGLQDAVNLADKLVDICLHQGDHRLLDLYNLQRMTATKEYVQAQTIQNKKRLEESDPATRQKNLDQLRATAGDRVRAKEFVMRTSMLTAQRRIASIGL